MPGCGFFFGEVLSLISTSGYGAKRVGSRDLDNAQTRVNTDIVPSIPSFCIR